MSFERPTQNSARTRRAYSAAPDEILAAIEKAVGELPRWTLESNADGGLSATRRTRLGFTDDIMVRVVEKANGSEAHFESASRVGKGDLGQNPRNLEELLKAINEALGQET